MTLHVFEPESLSDWHGGHCLAREGLMVELGTIGFVGVDLCRSPAERGRILAMKYSEKILHREAALWVHTGLHTPTIAEAISSARVIDDEDVVVLGGQPVTSLERTAIDLLITSKERGIEYLCALARAGTSVDAVQDLAAKRALGGIVRVRSILRQLPRDLGVRKPSPSP